MVVCKKGIAQDRSSRIMERIKEWAFLGGERVDQTCIDAGQGVLVRQSLCHPIIWLNSL